MLKWPFNHIFELSVAWRPEQIMAAIGLDTTIQILPLDKAQKLL